MSYSLMLSDTAHRRANVILEIPFFLGWQNNSQPWRSVENDLTWYKTGVCKAYKVHKDQWDAHIKVYFEGDTYYTGITIYRLFDGNSLVQDSGSGYIEEWAQKHYRPEYISWYRVE